MIIGLDSLNGQGITSNPTSPPIIVFNHSPMEKFDNKVRFKLN